MLFNVAMTLIQSQKTKTAIIIMTFKTLSNLRSSKFIGWDWHLATVKMLLVNNQWLYYECCHLSVLH